MLSNPSPHLPHDDLRTMPREQFLLPLNVHKLLEDLVDLRLATKSYGPPTFNARERKAAFREWCQTKLSVRQRDLAANISLSQSLEKAREYLYDEFLISNPEYREPKNRIGRPTGFVPIETQRKVARGEVITMLLELGYKKLLKELGGEGNVADK